MTATATATPHYRYHALFPSWEGARPLAWFFAEQLLEARAASDFPTNAAGEDEDVNIYLVGLLQAWALGDGREAILPGRDPLLLPPTGERPRAHRAEHYRRQADHRLLALGLFDRGDLVRRRRCGWRMSEEETRAADLAVMVGGYRQAADLLDGRAGDRPGLVAVWRKLAGHAPRYVHVLQTLARLRLGFGARLDDDAITRLLASAGQE